jgi:hypothetical protein
VVNCPGCPQICDPPASACLVTGATVMYHCAQLQLTFDKGVKQTE